MASLKQNIVRGTKAFMTMGGSEVYNYFNKGSDAPQAPAPPIPLPGPPTLDDARLRQDSIDAVRRRRGRASTVLSGFSGAEPGYVATATLLGG